MKYVGGTLEVAMNAVVSASHLSKNTHVDNQMQQGLYISKWQKVDAKNPYSVEKTGYTFAPIKYIESYVASTPTSCQMKRPG